jgi:hypothetical protein
MNAINIVQGIVSIPNIGLLIKISPFLLLVDDLSYFVYYNSAHFDTTFRFVSELCWNWTHSKWELPKPVADALGLDLSSTQKEPERWLKDTTGITPKRLAYRTEDLFFLNNCKGYLLYTVPFSTLMFVALWKLYWRFHQSKFASVIASFSSFAYLFVSLVGENAQFLAFKCFEQLRFVVPLGGKLYYLNLVLTYTVLFACLICVISLYVLAWNMARQTFGPIILRRIFTAFVFLGTMGFFKFVFGFIHAYL